MPTDKASYKAVDTGDRITFPLTGADSTGAPDGDNEGRDAAAAGVPKVWPDGSVSDGNFNSVAPKQMSIAKGHDTYQGIPGDGIVGGNPGMDHNTPAAWSASIKTVKGSAAGGNTAGTGGGGAD